MQLFPRSSRLSRRTAAFVGGAVIGLLSVGAFAAPASAHHVTLTGGVSCENGRPIVTWTLKNDWHEVAHLEDVQSTPAGLQLPGEIRARHDDERFATLTVIQRFTDIPRRAELTIGTIRWDDNRTQSDVEYGVDTAVPCPAVPKPPKPPKPGCVHLADAAFSHTLDGAAGKATVTLEGDKPLCKREKQPFALISYLGAAGPTGPELKFDSDTGAVTKDSPSTNLTVKLPPCATKVYLVWGKKVLAAVDAKHSYGDRVLGSRGRPGSRSRGDLGVYTGGEGTCGDKPIVTFDDNCKGVAMTLINRGTTPATFFGEARIGTGPFKPFDKPVTVAPGKTAPMVVPGAKGLTVRVTSGATLNVDHSWLPPVDCTPPAGPKPPGGGASPGLPVTGARGGIMAAAAAALTGAGIALMVVTRRRRQSLVPAGIDDATRVLPTDEV